MTHMNLSMKQKQKHGHREQTGGCRGGGVGGGVDWEVGVSRCELLYREWINNKVLLYSTGNYIPYSINQSGKEYKKKNVSICITESLCCTAVINTTL